MTSSRNNIQDFVDISEALRESIHGNYTNALQVTYFESTKIEAIL